MISAVEQQINKLDSQPVDQLEEMFETKFEKTVQSQKRLQEQISKLEKSSSKITDKNAQEMQQKLESQLEAMAEKNKKLQKMLNETLTTQEHFEKRISELEASYIKSQQQYDSINRHLQRLKVRNEVLQQENFAKQAIQEREAHE